MNRRILQAVVTAFALVLGMVTTAVAAPPAHQSFVVVLEPGSANVRAVAADLARGAGGELGFVYEHSIQGFSMTASPAAAAALARNPRVAYVEADREFSVSEQTVPTGIKRIFAPGNANIDIDGVDDFRVDVDVAVIDTGIDWQHPDLNVVAGINCASGSPFRASCSGNGDDDHYHGTHVAGTIAALDNGLGVVGVAPGARLHAVKVLNSQGSGYTSWIVAGIDWVAGKASTIEVANMSLGGSGYSQAQYDAIQRAVNKGVAFAVAAGNSDADANNYSPAAFDNVLTVSALADFDGIAGRTRFTDLPQRPGRHSGRLLQLGQRCGHRRTRGLHPLHLPDRAGRVRHHLRDLDGVTARGRCVGATGEQDQSGELERRPRAVQPGHQLREHQLDR
jgi:subtilisin